MFRLVKQSALSITFLTCVAANECLGTGFALRLAWSLWSHNKKGRRHRARHVGRANDIHQPGDLPELPPFLADAIQTLVLYCTRADKESVMAAIEWCMDRHSNIVTLARAARRDILFRRLLVQLPIFTQSPIDQGT